MSQQRRREEINSRRKNEGILLSKKDRSKNNLHFLFVEKRKSPLRKDFDLFTELKQNPQGTLLTKKNIFFSRK